MGKYSIKNRYFLIDKRNKDFKIPVYITDMSDEYLFLNDIDNENNYKSPDYVLELASGKIENKNIKLQKYK
jgi:outer membrane receptor for Fe3+-dicitrate